MVLVVHFQLAYLYSICFSCPENTGSPLKEKEVNSVIFYLMVLMRDQIQIIQIDNSQIIYTFIK